MSQPQTQPNVKLSKTLGQVRSKFFCSFYTTYDNIFPIEENIASNANYYLS